MKKILFLITLVFCFQAQLRAVPAYPYPIEIIQPDGSSLTIVQKGDEFLSWIETTDGYSIVKNANGIFEYATLGKNQNIIPSGVKVKNVAERTAIETAFVASISQSQTRAKLFVQQNEMMQLRASEALSTVQTSAIGTRKVLCILRPPFQ